MASWHIARGSVVPILALGGVVGLGADLTNEARSRVSWLGDVASGVHFDQAPRVRLPSLISFLEGNQIANFFFDLVVFLMEKVWQLLL